MEIRHRRQELRGQEAIVLSASSAETGTSKAVELRGDRGAMISDFRFQRSDFSFRLDARMDLERIATTGPALWAVTALAQDPDDEGRRERALGALRAAGEGLAPGGRGYDLSVLRIEGGGILGAVLVLFEPEGRIAYLLTPDVGLADQLAARGGRMAGALVDVLCPREDGARAEIGFGRRVREAAERFGPQLAYSGPGGESVPPDGSYEAAGSAQVIVRAARSAADGGRAAGRRVRAARREGLLTRVRRAGQVTGWA